MKAYCRDLGRMDYKTCWDLQQELFDAGVARKRTGPIPVPGADGADDAGTVLLVEHPPVYTLGKSGHAENLLVNQEALEAMGAQFFHIDRGGDITFHGPGQLVCYPILDLECLGIGLRDYIGALEEAVIRTVAVYGITAGRMAGASGVWIGPGIGGEQGAGQPPAAEITAAATATSAVTAATKASAAKAATAAKTATRQEPAIAAESAIAKSASGTGHPQGCRARFAQ